MLHEDSRLSGGRKVKQRSVCPVGAGARDGASPENRWAEAACYDVQGQIARYNRDTGQESAFFRRGIELLEENLRVRDLQANAHSMRACFRNTESVGRSWRSRIGARVYPAGLGIMCALRDSKSIMLTGDLLRDISEAEENLQRYRGVVGQE